jgi:sugar phosphate isomerase/epimerase
MRYAFMSFSCTKATFPELLATATRFGYDGVEPRAQSNHGHGVEFAATTVARKTIRRQAEDAGIAICCLATSCRFADPSIVDAQLDDLRCAIDLAGDIGAPRIRVFGGKLGAGLSREAATDLVAQSLRSVADQAAARHVTLCLETHDDWTNPDHVAAVMKAVNHPAVAVNWDLMHPVRFSGWKMADAFAVVRPWIRHVHFHDGSTNPNDGQMRPMGTGDIDHRIAVKLLAALPYDGYLSGEWINWEPADVHLPRELAAMKAYEREA